MRRTGRESSSDLRLKEGDDMFDADKYLQRIGCGGETGVDLATLRKLHKNHLMTIPYNGVTEEYRDGVNLVDIDEDATFETTIVGGRGGTCFQLNRLFFRLLRELGYDVTLMAAKTAEGQDAFGLDVEHMFSRVALDGEEWLVDVGYPGPSFIEPLLISDAVQTQYGCQYRLVESGSEIALQRRGAVTRWSVVYTFTRESRQWTDWKEMEDLLRDILSQPRSNDGQEILCGRSFENGQAVLKGRRYLTVRDGREQARTITDDDEHRTLITRVLSGELG
ncbi:arylamine N-acetyltransferase [Streptomyces sp. NPDC002209]|uniref:arylamine N-acetyltransferase n=1 Tax=Streptomyces sp. NPDC002209 TaxID=3364638 RepID=UPI0036791288